MVKKNMKEDMMDYDPTIQGQFQKAAEVPFPTETVVKQSALLDWAAIEESAGVNREWFWNALLPPVAFFSDFLEVEVHPGWIGKCSRMGSLVRNPGDNKDPPVDILASAVREIQDDKKKLYLLDEFSMPFLYQALKSNDCRSLGMYTELDSLLQKCTQQTQGSVVDAKTRMLRIYDCRHWGYGIKGEASFAYDQMEEIPKSLFPIFGATQPEVWCGHNWLEPLSGFWQRWAVICTPPKVSEWPADRTSIKSSKEVKDCFRDVLANVGNAAYEMRRTQEKCRFKFRDDTYKQFGELRDRMQAIKDDNKTDPVLLSSVSKVMREVVSTSGLIHALDQGAENCEAWEPEIPPDVYERAQAQVQYHVTVALRGRPPQASSKSLTTVNVCLSDSVDTLRLRRAICNMRGQSNISGTTLRKFNLFGDLTPEQWKNETGRALEELGLITINVRSYGYSITKKPIPSQTDEPDEYETFKTLLQKNLRLTVEEYAESLKEPAVTRRQAARPSVVEPVAAKSEVKNEEAFSEEDDLLMMEPDSAPARPQRASASASSARPGPSAPLVHPFRRARAVPSTASEPPADCVASAGRGQNVEKPTAKRSRMSRTPV